MGTNIYTYDFPGPIGSIGIAETGGAICRILFGMPGDFLNASRFIRELRQSSLFDREAPALRETDVLKLAAGQFSEYLGGGRASFDLPLINNTSGFTKLVYDELLKIPAGQTRSYREVAVACGNPKAFRAVGMINKNNPIPFFIPCHRVIGSDGSLVGYAGGLAIKQYLLDLEKTYYSH